MKRWLLFTNGGGSTDPLNWDRSEAALYSSDDLKNIKPSAGNKIELTFKVKEDVYDVVTLKIENRSHTKVISAIANAIEKSNQAVIPIADVDNSTFISPHVYGVELKTVRNYILSLTNNSRTAVPVPKGNIKSLLAANTDSQANSLSLELYDGSAYTYICKAIAIPTSTTLKLESDEISFDDSIYTLHATASGFWRDTRACSWKCSYWWWDYW